jgi:hypothetical protein
LHRENGTANRHAAVLQRGAQANRSAPIRAFCAAWSRLKRLRAHWPRIFFRVGKSLIGGVFARARVPMRRGRRASNSFSTASRGMSQMPILSTLLSFILKLAHDRIK